MTDWDYNYTRIVTFTVSKTDLEWKPDCDCLWNPWDLCDCYLNPGVDSNMIDVRVVGNPIKTKPYESTYNIRIWTDRYTNLNNVDIDFFGSDEVEPDFEFIIVNSMDTEYKPNINLVRQYLVNVKNIDTKYVDKIHIKKYVNEKKFKGTTSISSYIKSYMDIVDGYMKPVKMVGTENPHIKKKQKKYKKIKLK